MMMGRMGSGLKETAGVGGGGGDVRGSQSEDSFGGGRNTA